VVASDHTPRCYVVDSIYFRTIFGITSDDEGDGDDNDTSNIPNIASTILQKQAAQGDDLGILQDYNVV
jgi:hypothetical protein